MQIARALASAHTSNERRRDDNRKLSARDYGRDLRATVCLREYPLNEETNSKSAASRCTRQPARLVDSRARARACDERWRERALADRAPLLCVANGRRRRRLAAHDKSMSHKLAAV